MFFRKVSADKTGDDFITCLIDSGVESFVNQTEQQQSGECLVLITPDNERTMNTYLGSSSLLDVTDINKDALVSSEYLLIEGYLVTSEDTLSVGMSALEHAEQTSTKKVITLSDPNIVSFFRDSLLKLFKNKADIVFCNEQEALNFSETDNLKDAQEFLRGITNEYVITLGGNGAVCFDSHNLYSTKGLNVSSKDFTGAGDMFLGAYMHKYDGTNPQESLNFANYCSSKIIQVYGAKLGHKDSYSKLLNDFKS